MSDTIEPSTGKRRSDIAHALVKGVLGSIPMGGGFAAELFALVLRPPFEQRADAWMHEVAGRLISLENRDPERFAALAGDETFVSVAIAATQAAFRARHDAKRALLANAVEASAAGSSIDPDLQLTFVRFVDELTPSHVTLLEALETSRGQLQTASSYTELHAIFGSHTGTACTSDEFMLLCSDVTSRALLRVSRSLESFGDVGEADYITTEGRPARPLVRVTDVGTAFLKFVGPPQGLAQPPLAAVGS